MDNLLDFTDLKNMLDLEQSSIASYPALETISELVLPAIEGYLGVELAQEERTELIYPTYATKMIGLNALPVVSVDSVDIDDLAITDYTIVPYGLKLASKLTGDVITVVYTGGYLDPPEWLRRASTLQAAYEYQGKNHIGAEYVSNTGGAVQKPALQLLPEVRRILNPNRHPINRFN